MKIHFIGIGGIGVSALARYYLAQGFEVSGSDVAESEIVEGLRKLGAKIPHPSPLLIKERERYSNIDLVVYSAAVQEDNQELVEARRRGIKCQTYAQALGELTKKYFTIAVSGTHGKSTTTAMIGLILEAAGFDPTVIVGTKIKEWGFSNCRIGKSKYLVIEADEYAASFLNYWPKIIVLTNIEEDHLDYYRNLNHIMETFGEYISHLKKDGVLVANGDDKNIAEILKNSNVIARSPELARLAEAIGEAQVEGRRGNPVCGGKKMGLLRFARNDKAFGKLKKVLKVPGEHNVLNALAALAVAKLLKIPDKISIKTLNNFIGTWRRMEYKGEINGAKIYDDYGHHPTEIRATLQGARELLRGAKRQAPSAKPKLWCVFQPHQYQRTYQLFDQFADSFSDADKVILLPIYSVAGREKEEIKKKVNSEMLALRLQAQGKQEVMYLDSFEKTKKYLKTNLKRGDVCVIMGAGDIYKLTDKLIGKNL